MLSHIPALALTCCQWRSARGGVGGAVSFARLWEVVARELCCSHLKIEATWVFASDFCQGPFSSCARMLVCPSGARNTPQRGCLGAAKERWDTTCSCLEKFTDQELAFWFWSEWVRSARSICDAIPTKTKDWTRHDLTPNLAKQGPEEAQIEGSPNTVICTKIILKLSSQESCRTMQVGTGLGIRLHQAL